MFANHLYNIKRDLSYHHRDKDKLLEYYVQQRLNQSLYTYYKELSSSVNYLSNRNPMNVIRKM